MLLDSPHKVCWSPYVGQDGLPASQAGDCDDLCGGASCQLKFTVWIRTVSIVRCYQPSSSRKSAIPPQGNTPPLTSAIMRILRNERESGGNVLYQLGMGHWWHGSGDLTCWHPHGCLCSLHTVATEEVRTKCTLHISSFCSDAWASMDSLRFGSQIS